MKLGVLGYSAQEFDVEKALAILRTELSSRPEITEVVSGLTNIGIPALAYQVAVELELSTTGIACVKARNYQCFPCDTTYVLPQWQQWGDESQFFVNYCDTFLRIGGGKQSEDETKLIHLLQKEIKVFTL